MLISRDVVALAREVDVDLPLFAGIEESWFLSRGTGTEFAIAVSKSFLKIHC